MNKVLEIQALEKSLLRMKKMHKFKATTTKLTFINPIVTFGGLLCLKAKFCRK